MQILDFLNTAEARDVCEGVYVGVQHMSDHEIEQSIIADLVVILKEVGALHWTELFHFIRTKKQTLRVLNALIRLTDQGMVIEEGQYVRLRTEKTSALQMAMDFAGVYCLDYPGITYPDGLIQLSDTGRDVLEQLGVDGAAEMLVAELQHPITSVN